MVTVITNRPTKLYNQLSVGDTFVTHSNHNPLVKQSEYIAVFMHCGASVEMTGYDEVIPVDVKIHVTWK